MSMSKLNNRQICQNTAERWVSLWSKNKEIDKLKSVSKFDIDYFKFKVEEAVQNMNAVRDNGNGKTTVLCTNHCAWREMGFRVQPFPKEIALAQRKCVRCPKHENGILQQKRKFIRDLKKHLQILWGQQCQKKFEIKLDKGTETSSQLYLENKIKEKKKLPRSNSEKLGQEIIWKCNKELVFRNLTKTVCDLEKEIIKRQFLRKKRAKLQTCKGEEEGQVGLKVESYADLDVTSIAKIQQVQLQRLHVLLGRGSGSQKPGSNSGTPGGEKKKGGGKENTAHPDTKSGET